MVKQSNLKVIKNVFVSAGLLFGLTAASQNTGLLDSANKIIVPGKQYSSPSFHQKLWGKHYREEWTTPVVVRKVNLDTLAGGLTPYEKGGGRQTKTLRLKNAAGREYVLRSIDKSFGKALPETFRGTFIENIIDDQVSTAHPYAAITIPTLAKAAKIYYAIPEIVFVPKQPALGEFNDDFGDDLYLFEQRPDENWEEAENFGYAKKIISTDKMLEEIIKNNTHRVDQRAYVRARLFDMVIGDWGRHEDQWRWASVDTNGITTYLPIPRDRDQTFTKFDGIVLSLAKSFAGVGHLQTFDYTIKNIKTFNYPARNLDRRLANELSRDEWLTIARDLQQLLTDTIIEIAVKRLPPEVFPLSGGEIIAKLKSRRNLLTEYAEAYYKFLSEQVEVVGTDKKERFTIEHVNEKQTLVKVFDEETSDSFFSRIFSISETDEIRMYGLSGDDIFQVSGNTKTQTRIRIIGGDGYDSINIDPLVGRKKIFIYDSEESRFGDTKGAKVYISNDSIYNDYKYDAFKYGKVGFRISPGLVYLDFGHRSRFEGWRLEPFGSQHNLRIRYQINKNALNIEYKGVYNQFVGRWSLEYAAGAWVPYVINFYGVGNETPLGRVRRFHRLRTAEYYANGGLTRNWKNTRLLNFSILYQTVKVKIDEDRFIFKFVNDTTFPDRSRSHFAGLSARYSYKKTDDLLTPTKGFSFNSSANYMHNLTNSKKSFTKLKSEASVYIPLIKRLSFAVRAGGATNIGDSEFYQLNRLGSDENLRGHRKQRFYGKTTFYNNNELRFMFDVKSKIFNGKMGFIGFFDNGRLWQPGEVSDLWHTGYGAGLFISPFKRALISAAYGISAEDTVISAYFGFYF